MPSPVPTLPKLIWEFILIELRYPTGFRLLISALWFYCGLQCVILAKSPWGTATFFGIYLAGVSLGIFITWAIVYGRARTLPFPACRCGKCHKFDDYAWLEGTFYGCQSIGVYMYKCQCGDYYLRSGKRFMELNEDGKTAPHKTFMGNGKWIDGAAT